MAAAHIGSTHRQYTNNLVDASSTNAHTPVPPATTLAPTIKVGVVVAPDTVRHKHANEAHQGDEVGGQPEWQAVDQPCSSNSHRSIG